MADKQSPLVSIIIPVFNAGVYVARAIQSLECQEYVNWECIVVDDGSTDNSVSQVQRYANGDARIKIKSIKNSGVVVARQNGFQASKGELVCFLDADDEFLPTLLSTIVDEFERTGTDIVQYGYYMLQGERQLCECHSSEMCGVKTFQEVIGCTQVSVLEHSGMCMWDKAYRRRIVAYAYDKISSVHISVCEDGLFALAAYLGANRIDFLSVSLYRYYQCDGSVLHTLNQQEVSDREMFVDVLRDLVKANNLFDDSFISKMVAYHRYHAVCQIAVHIRDLRGDFREKLQLARCLSKSNLLIQKNYNVRTVRRKLYWWILQHPFFFVGLCFLRGVMK